jgi:N6-adenosine-specific RNA methylase IME4
MAARLAGIYFDISTGGQWFWCLNDRAPSPAADRGYAPTRAKAILALKRAQIGADGSGNFGYHDRRSCCTWGAQ